MTVARVIGKINRCHWTTSAEVDSEKARKCEIGGAKKKKKQEKTVLISGASSKDPITMMV